MLSIGLSPTPDAASALQSSFNPVQLASQYEDALPGFSALSGTDKVIAGVDRISMKINTNQTIDLTSNDVLLGSGSVYNVLSLSTSKDFSGSFETIRWMEITMVEMIFEFYLMGMIYR